jgi:sugar phosphate isomerase/epimerase
VARSLNWNMTQGWSQGNDATEAFFRPVETFRVRFADLVADVRRLGFNALDLWTAQLNPNWALPDHVATAKEVLAAEGVSVPTIQGGSFGGTADELRRACQLAVALGASVLVVNTALAVTEPSFVVDTLEEFDVRLALENHPERTAAEILDRIAASPEGRIGTAVDTGWYGTQGYDAAKAIRELAPYIVAVHLKDVRAAGAHQTCRFGNGVVPVKECVKALLDIGYDGPISVEHEPEHYNPADELIANRELLETWLGGS